MGMYASPYYGNVQFAFQAIGDLFGPIIIIGHEGYADKIGILTEFDYLPDDPVAVFINKASFLFQAPYAPWKKYDPGIVSVFSQVRRKASDAEGLISGGVGVIKLSSLTIYHLVIYV